MKVSIGFHFAEVSQKHMDNVLNKINSAGLVIDGNTIEHVLDLDNGDKLLRVWTEATLEQFHEAADLLVEINNNGPIMFVVNGLTEQQFDFIEMMAHGNKIEIDSGAAEDNELFAYCEEADHIRILCNNLS